MSRRIPIFVAPLALLAPLGSPSPTRAMDYYWNAPGDGAFTSAPNWQPYNPSPPFLLGPGGVNDSVHFDLGTLPADRYTVDQIAGLNDELLIHSDSITLEFGDDYSLPNNQAGVPNFVAGVDTGDAADVVLTGYGGAAFQSNRTYIAASPGSSGTVTATGSDWVWNVDHQIMVGWEGNGALTIEDGAEVICFAPLIGTFADSIGTAIVRGVGSRWDAEGSQISVAIVGTATLMIEDGGSVESLGASIGNSSGGSGLALVHGNGSSWHMNGSVFLGYGGTGELAIEESGSVTAGQVWLGGWGDEGFGTGTVDVRGAGTHFTIGVGCGGCGGDLTVGVSNVGTLTIEGGGGVSNTGSSWLGLNPGSTGLSNVRGAGSRWDITQTLFVGDEGTGTVVVETGGHVASAAAWLGMNPDAIGTASVRGAGSSWDGSLLFVGGQGEGHLSIEDGGNLSNSGAWVGHQFGGSGTVAVRGAGSMWDVAGALRVGYSGDGTLVIEAGGDVASASADIAATFGSTSGVTVSGADSTWESGALHVGSAGTGALTISAGGVVASTDGTIGDRGTIQIEDSNSVWMLGGSLEMEDEAQAGTLGIGIAGPTAYGLVSVVGSAQLAGALELSLNGGFVPGAGDSFTVLTAGDGITGGFDNVADGQRLDVADGAGSFLVHYGATSTANPDHIVLTDFLVPEPDALLMASAASAALLSLRLVSKGTARRRGV